MSLIVVDKKPSLIWIIFALAIIYAIIIGFQFFKEYYWLLKLLLIISTVSALALAYFLYKFNVKISKLIHLPFIGLVAYPIYRIWFFLTTKSISIDIQNQSVRTVGYSVTVTRPYWFLLLTIIFIWIILIIQIKKSSNPLESKGTSNFDVQPKETRKSSRLILIAVIAIIIIVIFGAIFLFVKSGKGGSYVCSSDADGCFWRYSFVCQDCTGGKQCPKCEEFCITKGKESLSYAGQPVSMGKYCVCECK